MCVCDNLPFFGIEPFHQAVIIIKNAQYKFSQVPSSLVNPLRISTPTTSYGQNHLDLIFLMNIIMIFSNNSSVCFSFFCCWNNWMLSHETIFIKLCGWEIILTINWINVYILWNVSSQMLLKMNREIKHTRLSWWVHVLCVIKFCSVTNVPFDMIRKT